MLRKGAASEADHVFCDLEDAVAPSEKIEARDRIAWALNNLDWGKKTRSVRINDVTTEWCHGDIITILEKAGGAVDTLMLTKPHTAADVLFLDRLLLQVETRLKLDRRIGIEVLIEEVQALQNVEEISRCSDRIESLIFGMGDYSASQGIQTLKIGDASEYSGDLFYYPRFRITMAARAAGVDPVDGPYGNFNDPDGYRTEALRARAVGMVGKWAIHPSQIAPALDIFSPSASEIQRARDLEAAYRQAEAQGQGAAVFNGALIDVASLRFVRNTLAKAELMGV
jgi:citrate lyase subunit beta/citryl-CoA lyase